MRTVQLLAGSSFCRVATGEEGCIDDGSAGELSAKATRDVARVVITAISFTNTTVSASLFDRRHTRIVVILKPISAWSCLSILRFLRVCGVRLRWHISALTRIALRILRHYDTVNLELTVCRIDCALQHPISTLNVRMFNSCIESSGIAIIGSSVGTAITFGFGSDIGTTSTPTGALRICKVFARLRNGTMLVVCGCGVVETMSLSSMVAKQF